MKIAGIIVEYNPFHNGHLYHIQQSKEISNCDAILAIMSGNVTQRGLLSIVDKWKKTEYALAHGIDLVLELPVLYASQSTEYFAKGAVTALHTLGCIDYLIFGSESNHLKNLSLLADHLVTESPTYMAHLNRHLSKGNSYATAVQYSLKDITPAFDTMQSNDILAIAYLKQLKLLSSSIKAHSIQRKGASYNQKGLTSHFISASAIRHHLLTNLDSSSLKAYMPIDVYQDISNSTLMDQEDWYPYTRYMIISQKNNLSLVHEISEGLENRLFDAALHANNRKDFLSYVQTKRYNSSRISRILHNIWLQVEKKDMKLLQQSNDSIPYLRILGFTKKGQSILSDLRNTNTPSLINKAANYTPYTELGKLLWQYDQRSDQLYRMVQKKSTNYDLLHGPIRAEH